MRWLRYFLGPRRGAARERASVDSAESNDSQTDANVTDINARTVRGERDIPSVNRVRSLQSRVSSLLAVGLVSAIGLGLLFWYYSQALTRDERAQRAAERATQQRAKGEIALPPLGPIERPRVVSADASMTSTVLGPPPAPPAFSRATAARSGGHTSHQRSTKNAEAAALERRLSGAVLLTTAARSGDGNSRVQSLSEEAVVARTEMVPPTLGAFAHDSAVPPRRTEIESLLTASVVHASQARTLPSRRLLLPKGTFLDCTLETAIDSSLPGFVTCITATDTFSADGTVVLLERGSKLFGETRGQVEAGKARVFVLWNEARTPGGVTATLESPGTDELGRSGLPGRVNRHFFERFGAALLISVIDGLVHAAAQSDSDGTVIVNPSTSSQVLTEVLRNTINIRPTVLKHQGDRIQVLVARDVDFGSVYALHPNEP